MAQAGMNSKAINDDFRLMCDPGRDSKYRKSLAPAPARFQDPRACSKVNICPSAVLNCAARLNLRTRVRLLGWCRPSSRWWTGCCSSRGSPAGFSTASARACASRACSRRCPPPSPPPPPLDRALPPAGAPPPSLHHRAPCTCMILGKGARIPHAISEPSSLRLDSAHTSFCNQSPKRARPPSLSRPCTLEPLYLGRRSPHACLRFVPGCS